VVNKMGKRACRYMQLCKSCVGSEAHVDGGLLNTTQYVYHSFGICFSDEREVL